MSGAAAGGSTTAPLGSGVVVFEVYLKAIPLSSIDNIYIYIKYILIPYTSKDSKTRSVARRPSDRGPFVKGPKNVTCVKMRWHSAALFYLADLRLLVATRDDIFWLANLKLKQVARIKNRPRYLLGNHKHSGSKARILRA